MQVAVRAVQFNPLEPGVERADGRVTEGGLHLRDVGKGHRLRRAVADVEGDGAGRDDVPAALAVAERMMPLPRARRARFAPGVGELDARHRALLLDEGGNRR